MLTADQLAEHERHIVEAACTGQPIDLRVGDTERDDPAKGAGWDHARTVRAELLIELLTAERIPGSGRSRAIKIHGASITGPLDLEARTLVCPLLLQGCHFDESVNLDEATAMTIRLPGCHLHGLSAEQLRTTGNLELNDGFTANGEVNLLGACIGGQLSLTGAHLTNPDGHALNADRLTVDHRMFCREFAADGEVSLLGAHIGGTLEFDGACLKSTRGWALLAEGLIVDQSMFCRAGFTADGEVRMIDAHIRGSLEFDWVSLSNPKGLALHLRDASAARLKFWPVYPPNGGVDFTNARVGAFDDNLRIAPGSMLLRGFTYETLENDQISVRGRLRWLKFNRGGYIPQIYDQLATTYRNTGRSGAARQVGVAKEWRRRSMLNPLNWLLYLTVGYGYRTWLAGIWLAALGLLGTYVFARAGSHHLMHPSSNAPAFHPVAYTLDVLLPIVDLGQDKAWTPHGWALYWSWSLIAVGWVLTTAVVAGLTGIFKRD